MWQLVSLLDCKRERDRGHCRLRLNEFIEWAWCLIADNSVHNFSNCCIYSRVVRCVVCWFMYRLMTEHPPCRWAKNSLSLLFVDYNSKTLYSWLRNWKIQNAGTPHLMFPQSYFCLCNLLVPLFYIRELLLFSVYLSLLPPHVYQWYCSQLEMFANFCL